jgi:hypothetical protein
MGTLFVDKLDPQSGTSLELGSSGDTVSVNASATTNLAGNVTLGANGKTITVPAGATITNSGTATGFGDSNTPYFFTARTSSDQSISDGSATKVQFNSAVLDSDSGLDVSSNYRYTIPSGKGGIYKFDTSIKVSKGSGSNAIYYFIVNIKKNGSTQITSILDMRNPGNSVSDISQQLNQYAGYTANTAAGDYWEIFAEVFTNGNTPAISSGGYVTWFSGFRLATT